VWHVRPVAQLRDFRCGRVLRVDRFRALPLTEKAPRFAPAGTRPRIPGAASAVRRLDGSDRHRSAGPEGHADLFDVGTPARVGRGAGLLHLATGGGRLAGFGLYSGVWAAENPTNLRLTRLVPRVLTAVRALPNSRAVKCAFNVDGPAVADLGRPAGPTAR